MPRKREPLKLLEAKGKSHMPQSVKAEREEAEVKTPEVKQVRAPKWLPTDLREEFNFYSRQLVALKIFSPLDRDTLARYLVAKQVYLASLNHVEAAISAGESGAAVKWSTVQNKYYAQCRECAGDLGLTITSRCRLVVPKKDSEDEDDPFLRVIEGRRNA